MVQLGFNWKDFHVIWYLSIFRKSVEKIEVSLKYDKNNVYCMWRPIYIYDHVSHFFLELEMFHTKVIEKLKTQILCSITSPLFFFFSKIFPLMRYVGKYYRVGQATGDSTAHALCVLDK